MFCINEFIYRFLLLFLCPDLTFVSWKYLFSITSYGYVVTRFDDEYSKWQILCESADDVKYKNDVKYKTKNVSCIHEKKLQNVWNWSTAMDLIRTDIKQQNKNVNRLTFVFEHVNKYTIKTRRTTNVFEWYNL